MKVSHASLCLFGAALHSTASAFPTLHEDGPSAHHASHNRDFCQKPLPANQALSQTANVTIQSGGLDRWYLITIPPSYYAQTAAPVILSFHGGSRTAGSQLALSEFSNPDYNTNAIAIYPQGINNTWQGIPGQDASIDDIQLTLDILSYLDKNYCIDSTRIYAAGKSNGGGFSNTLACSPKTSKIIAAFALVSGSYYVDSSPCVPATLSLPCNPARSKIPVIVFHGAVDDTINYFGGVRKKQCLPTIPHFVNAWAERDGLGTANTTRFLNTKKDTIVYMFGSGDTEGLITHINDTVIGHDWPSTVLNSDNSQEGRVGPASFNATPIIMDFFFKHPLNLFDSK